jgi:hypothetical protein
MSRISWLINRLRLMSVPEVVFRIRRSFIQQWERRRVAAGWRPLPDKLVAPGCALFGDDVELPEKWNKNFQLNFSQLDDCLAGRINFFGHESLDVGNPVVWNRDPVTGIEAPGTYGKDLNYRDDHLVGNVKFTWELGRHQHLVPLAVAYVASGDIRYRQAVVEQIDSWIEQNPFGVGIHWCTSLEVSLRLISWAMVHSLLVLKDGKSGLFASTRDSKRLGESIYQQAYFVRHFLSRYSSANNHLIGELAGLWVACQVFDLGDEGQAWSEFAHQELEYESRQQVHEDGVNKEQAFYYHLWVLEYLLFVRMVAVRSGRDFSDEFTRRIMAMARFLEDVSPDGGEPPQVGDADDGFVTRFEPEWPESPYRELLDAVTGVFNGADVAGGQKAFWYRAMMPVDGGGRPGLDWRRSYPVSYPQGGYVVIGGAGCHVVFDAGPLGYLGIAAHGHADALSFCLAVDGEWWLVDPGTYAYHSAPEWRSFFRGTAAHNTIRVNREDQSQIAGPFMWLRKANAWIDDLSEVGNIQKVSAHHDGYDSLGVVHRRELQFSESEGQLDVIDRLQGGDEQKKFAEIYYHFAPEVDIKPGPVDHCWTATWEGRQKRLLIYTDPCWNYAVVKGGTNPVAGWYSPALEEKIPSNTLRGEAPWSASLTSTTKIVIE